MIDSTIFSSIQNVFWSNVTLQLQLETNSSPLFPWVFETLREEHIEHLAWTMQKLSHEHNESEQNTCYLTKTKPWKHSKTLRIHLKTMIVPTQKHHFSTANTPCPSRSKPTEDVLAIQTEDFATGVLQRKGFPMEGQIAPQGRWEVRGVEEKKHLLFVGWFICFCWYFLKWCSLLTFLFVVLCTFLVFDSAVAGAGIVYVLTKNCSTHSEMLLLKAKDSMGVTRRLLCGLGLTNQNTSLKDPYGHGWKRTPLETAGFVHCHIFWMPFFDPPLYQKAI